MKGPVYETSQENGPVGSSSVIEGVESVEGPSPSYPNVASKSPGTKGGIVGGHERGDVGVRSTTSPGGQNGQSPHGSEG